MKRTFNIVSLAMIFSLLFSAVGLPPTPARAASAWEDVGSAGFSAGETAFTSLALDNGTPFVAYEDGANGWKATVMKFNGSDWQTVGATGFSADATYFISLALDNGTPFVAYSDNALDGKATVMKFNGSSWQTVGVAGFSAGRAWYTSLAVENGVPYVAYSDAGNEDKATVMKFNGLSWESVGAAGFSTGGAFETSLAVENGTPYVAYKDYASDYKATVMKFNGLSWESVGAAGFSAGQADYISLAVENGTPYVAYADGALGGEAIVLKFTGSIWNAISIPLVSFGGASYTSLALNNGTPYVAYRDNANGGKATVMKFNGSSWESVGAADFSAGQADYTSLALDGNTPYVAYGDVANGVKATVMKYVDSSFESVPLSPPAEWNDSELRGVWGSSAQDVYAVGWGYGPAWNDMPLLYHNDGTGWIEDTPSLPAGWNGGNLLGVWGLSADDVYVVGTGIDTAWNYIPLIYHNDGTGWTDTSFLPAGRHHSAFWGVWGSSANDVYAVGSGYIGAIPFPLIYRYDGSVWTESSISLPPGLEDGRLTDVWGSSASDIYAVGFGHDDNQAVMPLLYHYNGTSWTETSSSLPSLPAEWNGGVFLSSVWGLSADDVYVVGAGNDTDMNPFPVVYHNNGNGWTEHKPSLPLGWSNGELYSVWGASANDVYAVGEGWEPDPMPLVYHNDGTGWTEVNPALPAGWSGGYLYGIWGSSTDDVYVVGEGYDATDKFVPLLYQRVTAEPEPTVPDTTITSSPPNPSTSANASFAFTSSVSGSTFECSLDSTTFAACTSPRVYTGLANGEHIFQVRAVKGGETDPSPASYTWSIITSTLPPKAVLLWPNGNIGDMSNPIYTWQDVGNATHYQIGLRDPAWAPFYGIQVAAAEVCDGSTCSAPHSLMLPSVTLSEGQYTWYIRAYNSLGYGSWSDPMVFTLTSVVAPNTTLTSQPVNPSNSANASFSFISTPAGASFECKLDSSAFTSCTSPKTYSGLSDSSHTFQVRATDSGMTDPTPASYTWTIDTTPPDTTLTNQPANPSNSTDASFEFTSTPAGATFECKLDSAVFASCISPKTYSGLSDGTHTFQVRAKDVVGNVDATPAIYTWVIGRAYGAGMYDDAHAAWTYSGNWTAHTGAGPANNTMHLTNAQNASASITFTGTQFTVYFAKYTNRGDVEVWIDGVHRYTFNENGSPLAWQQSWSLPTPLSNGTHTVQFKNPSADPATYIDIDAIQILGPVQPVGPGTYDDADAAWSYAGNWTAHTGSGPANNTMHFTNAQNASASITFSGTQFTVYFARYSNRGDVEVWIDGVQQHTFNENGSTLAWQSSWTLPTPLSNGTHTVQFKNPSANPATYIDIDAIQILGPVQPVGPGTYDDADAAWSYTGAWTAHTGSGAVNNTMHFTNVQNASASLTFTGTQFTVYFAKYINRGSVEVWIDGVQQHTFNENGGTLAWQQSWTLPTPLSNGTHTVQFKNPSADPATYIDIDAIQILGPVQPVGPGTYDDADAAWSYTGAWTAHTGSGPTNNTMHFTNAQNASAGLTFTGTRFMVYFAKYTNRGSVEVWIDGVKQHTFSENGNPLAWQSSWALPTPLSNGTHTVQFKNPSNNPATYIDIDTITILP